MNIELINYSPLFNRQLCKLFHNSIHKLCSSDYTPEQLDAWSPSEEVTSNLWISRISDENCFVAIIDEELAGFISVQFPNYIDLLYVDENYVSKGVASYMYNFAEEELFQRVDDIYTFSSKTAQSFFSKMGFTIERPNKVVKFGVELENYLMRKKLLS